MSEDTPPTGHQLDEGLLRSLGKKMLSLADRMNREPRFNPVDGIIAKQLRDVTHRLQAELGDAWVHPKDRVLGLSIVQAGEWFEPEFYQGADDELLKFALNLRRAVHILRRIEEGLAEESTDAFSPELKSECVQALTVVAEDFLTSVRDEATHDAPSLEPIEWPASTAPQFRKLFDQLSRLYYSAFYSEKPPRSPEQTADFRIQRLASWPMDGVSGAAKARLITVIGNRVDGLIAAGGPAAMCTDPKAILRLRLSIDKDLAAWIDHYNIPYDRANLARRMRAKKEECRTATSIPTLLADEINAATAADYAQRLLQTLGPELAPLNENAHKSVGKEFRARDVEDRLKISEDTRRNYAARLGFEPGEIGQSLSYTVDQVRGLCRQAMAGKVAEARVAAEAWLKELDEVKPDSQTRR